MNRLVFTLCIFLSIFDFIYGQDCQNFKGRYEKQALYLDGEFELHWTINLDQNTLSVGMLGKTAIGWVGFGIATEQNPGMVGAESVLGWVNGTEAVNSYRLEAKKGDAIILNNENIPLRNTSACTFLNNGSTWTAVHFTRNIKDGNNTIFTNGNISTPIVVGIGARGAISYHPDKKREVAFINFAKGESKTSSNVLFLLHGALLFITWGVAVQFGALFARYAKLPGGTAWFIVHKWTQGIAFLISIAGFVISFIMVRGSHFNTKVHGQLGVTIMVMGVIQIVLGITRPHKEQNAPKTIFRSVWEYIHWWFGRITLVFALVNILLGLIEYNASNTIITIYLVYIGVLLLSYAILELRKKIKQDSMSSENHYSLIQA